MTPFHRLWRLALAAPLTAFGVGGCVLPVPAYYASASRHNLSETSSQFIVPGRTTRIEVLFELGAADVRADEDRQLRYESAYHGGGVLISAWPMAAAGSSSVTYRRLDIYFDEDGVVKRKHFEEKVCQEGGVGTAIGALNSKPCRW